MRFLILLFLTCPFIGYSQTDELPAIEIYDKEVGYSSGHFNRNPAFGATGYQPGGPRYKRTALINGKEFPAVNKVLLPLISQVPLAYRQYKKYMFYGYSTIPFLGGAFYCIYNTFKNKDDKPQKAARYGVATLACIGFVAVLPQVSQKKFRQSIATYNAKRIR